ncbi:hypothetical protein BAnh1_06540 [Bartonella australis AUST/NH1]|uniref:PepSY domain-containing protein n=1 Tax=Bartonella australis (strain Aust/NH1) TaxID=1094489 RepID=M1NTA1_BARAA|nr:hypothetical protein [Bartonella australis]AGF74533.1 hypothetical protein BAnh1_06540 [Bartonella australis AUST/NH1]
MRLIKNFSSIVFFTISVSVSTTTIASSTEIFYNPYCKTSEHIFTQNNLKEGQNSFTASQIKAYLIKNGFKTKRLRLDDKGIWRALVEFQKCHFFISVDYSGVVSVQNERKGYD